MRDYPSMIRNLQLNHNLDRISKDLDNSDFILKGRIDGDTLYYKNSKGEEKSISNAKHNGYVYLPNQLKRQLETVEYRVDSELSSEKKKLQADIVGTTTLCLASGVLCLPLLSVLSILYGSISFEKMVGIDNFYNHLDTDLWFSNNQELVNEKVKPGTPLYEKLSDQAKSIYNTCGITLNNIDEYKDRDLKLIKNTIVKEKEKNDKVRRKVFKDISRGRK